MTRLVALLLTLGTCFVGGCGGGDEPATSTASTPTGDGPLVTYEKNGGFAPVRETLTVAEDGAATLVTGPLGSKPKEADFSLTADELDGLTRAVDAADLDGFVKGTGVCADCFVYSLTTPGGEIKFTDVDLGEGSDARVTIEIFDLLDVVSKLVEQHAPADDAPATR